MCFMCKTVFDIKHDHNLLCCNNCLYKHTDSSDNIFQMNIYGIRKNNFLNYFTKSEYKALLIDEFLGDKLRERNV